MELRFRAYRIVTYLFLHSALSAKLVMHFFVRFNAKKIAALYAAAGKPSTFSFALGALPGWVTVLRWKYFRTADSSVAVTATAGAAMLVKLIYFYMAIYGITL